MAKFVKIPPKETVDAIQFKDFTRITGNYRDVRDPVLSTTTGDLCAHPGDWLVDDEGKQYVMLHNEFLRRFRRVKE